MIDFGDILGGLVNDASDNLMTNEILAIASLPSDKDKPKRKETIPPPKSPFADDAAFQAAMDNIGRRKDVPR